MQRTPGPHCGSGSAKHQLALGLQLAAAQARSRILAEALPLFLPRPTVTAGAQPAKEAKYPWLKLDRV